MFTKGTSYHISYCFYLDLIILLHITIIYFNIFSFIYHDLNIKNVYRGYLLV